jgi:hypothetical protein
MATTPIPLGVQKISDRTSEVILELGNRADLLSPAPGRLSLWYRNAYLNLCQGYDFEGLEYTLIQQISNTGTFTFPTAARAIKFISITDSSGAVTIPDLKDIGSIRRTQIATSPSIASMYTLYGNQLIFAPVFDSNLYTLTMDLWQRGLITPDVVSTPLLLPDDWLEAADYLTMMRGHVALGEPDKAMSIQRLMYGYTDPSSGQHVPGMLYNLQMRRQANAPARDYGLQPRSSRIKHTT